MSKVEQLELENDQLSRQINELKAQIYMSSALEETKLPKKARFAWPAKEDQDLGLSPQAREKKSVNFDEVVPRPEYIEERPPSTEPIATCLSASMGRPVRRRWVFWMFEAGLLGCSRKPSLLAWGLPGFFAEASQRFRVFLLP
eukprot:g18498.t1